MSKHVVVGAGPIGAATARVLAERGDDVVVVTRSGSGPNHPAITCVAADASSTSSMAQIARGAVAIYNCAGPAYQRWVTDWPPIAAALLAAATDSGAVLATAGNLYGYGPVSGPMTEDLPLTAAGPKGRTRAQMWRTAKAAHDAGRVRITEVRASDYVAMGPSSHLGDRVVPRLLAGRAVHVMKSADTPHTWTSVDDVARLIVTVAADERGWGKAWHVPSNPPRTQREAIADLCSVAGVNSVAVREYPTAVMRLLGAFDPVLRELKEVAYQFERPFVLDSSRAQQVFEIAPTPWPDVLGRLVAAYRFNVTTPTPRGADTRRRLRR
ncbi:NAD-dependent epimerase/dehydratase family protein [Pengzhenrongella sicca]|uniref:NAD-dependent epimerase/dehydratase family protein n=1 Tax=Pengzhenrongella sicca TaxID=2819238 RepID=A0A8A4ZC62_9MICO|nr:NAD-dependent epimerase/dehydratase family protein [Pengzhenrongella sicca]QTE28087.1 NAD-dependent epimerase/dehydratase family protein [Pengzhenrongella sicca]